jgi:hypothetical protein
VRFVEVATLASLGDWLTKLNCKGGWKMICRPSTYAMVRDHLGAFGGRGGWKMY